MTEWNATGYKLETFEDLCDMFVDLSGRADLAEPTAGPKSRIWVNLGIRTVDTIVEFESRRKIYAHSLDADEYTFSIEHLRRIWQVTSVNSDSNVTELIRIEDGEARFVTDASLLDSGTPAYYFVHRNIDASDSPSDLSDDLVIGEVGDLADDEYQISVLPPADESVSIVVEGWFYEPLLIYKADYNWITRTMPFAALYFALYHLERSYNNETGSQEWYRAGLTELQMYDREEASRLTTRSGEWK